MIYERFFNGLYGLSMFGDFITVVIHVSFIVPSIIVIPLTCTRYMDTDFLYASGWLVIPALCIGFISGHTTRDLERRRLDNYGAACIILLWIVILGSLLASTIMFYGELEEVFVAMGIIHGVIGWIYILFAVGREIARKTKEMIRKDALGRQSTTENHQEIEISETP